LRAGPSQPPAATDQSRLLLLAALRVEEMALRASSAVRSAHVATVARVGSGRRAGPGAVRARAGQLGGLAAVALAGIGGGLVSDLTPGHVVVANQVFDAEGHAVGQPLTDPQGLAEALRRAGLAVRVGPVLTAAKLVRGAAERARLAATGALAVDLESVPVLAAGWGLPFAVVRVVADTAGRELLSPATVTGGWLALRRLRTVAGAVAQWVDTLPAPGALACNPDGIPNPLGDGP
jgi:4-hydroxy-3-methylbut-2-en-1-yl diphosphate reductase